MVPNGLSLKNFELKANGKFCCKKKGCYRFVKYETIRKTQSSGVYLASPNGPRILKNHIDELPVLFYNVAQDLIKQVNAGCNN